MYNHPKICHTFTLWLGTCTISSNIAHFQPVTLVFLEEGRGNCKAKAIRSSMTMWCSDIYKEKLSPILSPLSHVTSRTIPCVCSISSRNYCNISTYYHKTVGCTSPMKLLLITTNQMIDYSPKICLKPRVNNIKNEKNVFNTHNSIQEEIKCRLKAKNSCYYSVQTLLSYKILIWISYSCKTAKLVR